MNLCFVWLTNILVQYLKIITIKNMIDKIVIFVLHLELSMFTNLDKTL